MASPRRRTALLAALLVPALAFAACGGDDDSSSSSSSTTTKSGSSGSDSSDSGATTTAKVGTGKGSLKIADKDLSFDATKCSIGGSDDQPSVAAEGKGEADGKSFTVVVKRSPTKDTVIETFQLAFSATESIVGTKFVNLPGGKDDTAITVKDKTATGTMDFLGSGGQPSGSGTFTVTCD